MINALTVKQFDLAPFAGDRLTQWILCRIRASVAGVNGAKWLALKSRASAFYLQNF